MRNSTLIYFLFGCLILFCKIEVRAQELDNFQVRFLTETTNANNYWACFSPDGKTIIFSRETDGEKWELMSISTGGGDVKKFFKKEIPVAATRASWSNTHNIIAFTGTLNGKSSVWLIDSNGTNARQLKIDSLSDLVFYPSWYPDGVHLAVMDATDKVIKRIDIQNQIAITITDTTKVLTGMPSVSPNGKWIAFAGQENIGKPYDQKRNSIWLVDETGNLLPLENKMMQGRTPAWSPDGKWIAFESNRGNSTGLYAIFIIKNDGTYLRRITPYELNSNHPIWSPDGKKILFSSVTISEKKITSNIAIIDIAIE